MGSTTPQNQTFYQLVLKQIWVRNQSTIILVGIPIEDSIAKSFEISYVANQKHLRLESVYGRILVWNP